MWDFTKLILKLDSFRVDYTWANLLDWVVLRVVLKKFGALVYTMYVLNTMPNGMSTYGSPNGFNGHA